MRNRNQVVLPLNLEICIPKEDSVFKLHEICEQLDYTKLYNTYLRSWRKVNPETLFELLVFGYMNRKYSARQIEEACRTDIRFIWILREEPVPDHSTIARFQNGIFLLSFAFNAEKWKSKQKSGRLGKNLFPLQAV